MSKPLAALMFAAFSMIAGTAVAEESPWLVRARAVHIDPADKSDPVGGTGASDRITVSSKTIPEVDISYFFSPNLAAELILTYPQKHDVYLDGKNIGTFKHLPPTLLVQYHFVNETPFKPYVGAGVNYTLMSKVNLANNTLGLEHDSLGFAVQAGVDYKIDSNWSLNLDVKKVQIRSDVLAAGAKISAVKVDPVLIGVGFGYRF